MVVPGSRKSMWITPSGSQKTVAMTFAAQAWVLNFLFCRWAFVMVFHGLTLGCRFIIMHPRFVSCHDIVQKFLLSVLIVWQKLLENLYSHSFHLCCWHASSPTCTNLPILKNISNVTHTFVWNAKLESSFPLSDPLIVLNQFIKLLLVKLIGCCHKSTLFITPSSFSSFAILTFYCPSKSQCSCQHSHHYKQPAFASEFQLETLLCSQKFNHSTLLKAHQQVLNSGFHFTHNSNTTS